MGEMTALERMAELTKLVDALVDANMLQNRVDKLGLNDSEKGKYLALLDLARDEVRDKIKRYLPGDAEQEESDG